MRRHRLGVLASTCFLLHATHAAAQVQTIVLAPMLGTCSFTIPTNPAALTVADATSLVTAATKSAPDAAKHYVLHVAQFNGNGSMQQEGWYAFRAGKLDRTRLYGASRATLILGFGSAPKFTDLGYTVTVTKKRAAPLQNLQDILRMGLQGGTAEAKDSPPSACAAIEFNINWQPSDMKFAAAHMPKGEAKQLSSIEFDNERRYAVDFTLALPLKSHNDLSYDVDHGVVTAKNVEKTDLFAVVNLGVPRDTKRMSLTWPTLLYGMPITGKPLKKQLIGLGFGTSRVQLFAGGLFTRREVAASSTAGGEVSLVVTADPKEAWDRSFVWGVNLSVKFVTDLLKAEK